MRYVKPQLLSTHNAVASIMSTGSKPAATIDSDQSNGPFYSVGAAYEADE